MALGCPQPALVAFPGGCRIPFFPRPIILWLCWLGTRLLLLQTLSALRDNVVLGNTEPSLLQLFPEHQGVVCLVFLAREKGFFCKWLET